MRYKTLFMPRRTSAKVRHNQNYLITELFHNATKVKQKNEPITRLFTSNSFYQKMTNLNEKLAGANIKVMMNFKHKARREKLQFFLQFG